MAKDLKEQIEIMTHYLNGGDVEFSEDCFKTILGEANNEDDGGLCWDWDTFDYRIVEQKQKVTIEKWLMYDISDSEYFTIETSDIITACNGYYWKKIKLLESYEIEL